MKLENRCLVAFAIVFALFISPSLGQVIVNVDPSIKYQQIRGWEATDWAIQTSPQFPLYKNQIFDMAVYDMGLSALRVEVRSGAENKVDYWTQWQQGIINDTIWRCVRYSTVNDDNNPNTLNMSGFIWSEFDDRMNSTVLPIKQRIESKGEKFFFNLEYVAFYSQMTQDPSCPKNLVYIHNDSQEYAEFMLAALTHINNTYGFLPDAIEVILEPDNTAYWRGNTIGQAIMATVNKVTAAGFPAPRFIAPSNTNMGNAVSYFDQMIQVPGVLNYLTELSYHRYAGVNSTNLQAIGARAVTYGVNTSMLEHIGSSYQDLHDDLTTGRNSAWQQYVMLANFPDTGGSLYLLDNSTPTLKINISSSGKFIRQYFKYVRPGAVRIDANTTNNNFQPIGFINPDGNYVVILKTNVTTGNAQIYGLPPGAYGVSYTTNSAYGVNRTDVVINSTGQWVTLVNNAWTVFTVYGKNAPLQDTTPPVISNGQPYGTLSAGTTSATLSVSTNEAATCKYSTTANTAYASMPNTFTTTGGITHSTSVSGLTNGSSYNYYVRCIDQAGNADTNDYTIAFSVASPPPPACPDGTAVNACSSTQPKYCNSQLQLVDSCSTNLCGCPSGQSCNATSQACFTSSAFRYTQVNLSGRLMHTDFVRSCAFCTLTIVLNGQSQSTVTNATGYYSIVIQTAINPGVYPADITLFDGVQTASFKRSVQIT